MSSLYLNDAAITRWRSICRLNTRLFPCSTCSGVSSSYSPSVDHRAANVVALLLQQSTAHHLLKMRLSFTALSLPHNFIEIIHLFFWLPPSSMRFLAEYIKETSLSTTYLAPQLLPVFGDYVTHKITDVWSYIDWMSAPVLKSLNVISSWILLCPSSLQLAFSL